VSAPTRPTVSEALARFGLDPRRVTRADVARAYREAARAHHPDRQPNFKRKIAHYEDFLAATEARGVLIDAFERGRLPRPDMTPGAEAADDRPQLSGGAGGGFRGTRAAEPPAFLRRLPSERLTQIPVIGPLVMFPVVVAVLILGFGAALVVWPVAVAAVFVRQETVDAWTARLQGFLTSLVMCAVYLVLCLVGAVVWSEAYPQAFPYLLAGAVWLAAAVSVDEVYCAVWYWRLRRGRGRALAPLDGSE
jgi:hypothetical protein